MSCLLCLMVGLIVGAYFSVQVKTVLESIPGFLMKGWDFIKVNVFRR